MKSRNPSRKSKRAHKPHHHAHPRWIAITLLAAIGALVAVAHARASDDAVDAEEAVKEQFDIADVLDLKKILRPADVTRINNAKGPAGLQDLDVSLNRTIVIKHSKSQETGYSTGEGIEQKSLSNIDKIVIKRTTSLRIEKIDSDDNLYVNFDSTVPGSILKFSPNNKKDGFFQLTDWPRKANFKTQVNVAVIPRVGPRVNSYNLPNFIRVKLRVRKDQIHEVVRTKRKAQGA